MNYFSISCTNKHELYAAGNGKWFHLDIRNPKNVSYFGKHDSDMDEIMVEYN